MRLIIHLLLLIVAVTLQSPQVAGQDLSDPLLDMQAISRALGVECNYCHARSPSDASLNFASEENPKKEIARQMIAMTRDLNVRVQTASGKPASQATKVHCLTCHRGNPVPKRLNDVIVQTIRDKGVAAAVTEYRELRAKFYGRDTYDFTEGELLDLARRLAESRPDDAIALLMMNLEFNPSSAESYIVMSRAYSRKRDTEMAVAQLKKALEIEPENGVAKGHLYQLEQTRRR
jgi:tetratricopeptide (TPR) repeat protein